MTSFTKVWVVVSLIRSGAAWGAAPLPCSMIVTGSSSDVPKAGAVLAQLDAALAQEVPLLAHDPEKWEPVFPRDKRRMRLRGDHPPTIGGGSDRIFNGFQGRPCPCRRSGGRRLRL